MKNYFLFLLSFGWLFSCQNGSVESTQEDNSEFSEEQLAQEGLALMEQHCYLCHSPSAGQFDGRVAPPMVTIKGYYIDKHPSKAEFVAAMERFVGYPTKEHAILLESVAQYGLMPRQNYPAGSVAKIAAFMFDYLIEEPNWFASYYLEKYAKAWQQSGSKMEVFNAAISFEAMGLEYALSTKKVLGSNLMGTIQEKGTLAALQFCNLRAYPLTDSMATVHNAEIKRVSDKPRNPNNAANAEEVKILEKYKKQIANNETMAPKVIEKGNKIHFYYPIETNTMCLQCHGAKVEPDVLKKIALLYPKDMALGYSENEIRGIWSIQFNK